VIQHILDEDDSDLAAIHAASNNFQYKKYLLFVENICLYHVPVCQRYIHMDTYVWHVHDMHDIHDIHVMGFEEFWRAPHGMAASMAASSASIRTWGDLFDDESDESDVEAALKASDGWTRRR
jgi:hypothetical protein